MLDGTIDGYERYEDAVAAQPTEPLADRDRRHRHAVLVGHDRPAEGRRRRRSTPEPLEPRRRAGRRRCCSCCSASPSDSVYLSPAPLYHAAPLRFSMASTPLGGTVVVMEHFDAEEYLRARRALPRHAQPGRADDVRAPAQAARRGARALRRVVAAVRHPRRRAVPGAGQAADDRVVRPGHPRVLRRHRGQRLRLLQQRAVARPPRHGRARRIGCAVHIVGDDGEELPPGESGHDLLRGRRARSSTTTTPRRRRRRATRRAGARSATSATSTTTASSTSPTARRT